jgi:hypothetical protein
METYRTFHFSTDQFPSDLDGNIQTVEIGFQWDRSGGRECAVLREALADHRWTFRTIDGLARQTRLSSSRVEEILGGHPALARKSVMKTSDGSDLFVARDRPPTARERLEQLRWLLAH